MPPDRSLTPARFSRCRGPQYVLNWPSVALAALLAASAITLYMLLIPRWLGIEEMDIGITVGGMAGGPNPFLARVAWHVGNGLVYVLPYAAILLRLGRQSNAWTGVLFGMFLWLVGPMLLIPILLDMHPLIQSGALRHPGIFMRSLGLGWKPAAVDVVAHLIHGILVGVIYQHCCDSDAEAGRGGDAAAGKEKRRDSDRTPSAGIGRAAA